MALASRPARRGQLRSLRRMRQVLSWALARSPGPRRRAWARLAFRARQDRDAEKPGAPGHHKGLADNSFETPLRIDGMLR